jgi:lysophospholipase
MSILVTSKRLTAKGLQFDLALLLKPMEPVRFKTSDVAKERLIDGQDTNKVLLLYTGGTIGMHETPRGLAPLAGYLEDYMMHNPQLHDRTLDAPVDSNGLRTLITPLSRFGRRTRYQIVEYAQLLDSCNMGIPQWLQIARDIERYYNAYDAFVVIHGTDTMAYSASVCSFLLLHLSKCVIFTGSQVPLCQSHNDGKENLLGAITIAGHLDIPEVCLYFNGKLMRGNRSKKVDCSDFDAFNSPNMQPLATLGVKLTVNWELVISKPVSAELRVHPSICPHVVCLRLYPGISHQLVENILREPTMGVVIESYGAGNGPDKDAEFLRVCKEATDRGVVICNVTQCGRGEVEAHYATGTALLDCGIVPLYDMTVEAALSKLSVLLGNFSSQEARVAMRTSAIGEMSDHQNEVKFSFVNSSFVLSVAAALKTTAVGDHLAIAKSIAPVLLCSAAGEGNIELLKSLISGQGLDPNSSDYDLRTPLHIAASERQPKAVELLLSYGARSNVEDRWRRTPLADAIDSVQKSGISSAEYDAAVEVVMVLVKNGSKIGGGSRSEMLCRFVTCSSLMFSATHTSAVLHPKGISERCLHLSWLEVT